MALTREEVIAWIKSRNTRELVALMAALEGVLELPPPATPPLPETFWLEGEMVEDLRSLILESPGADRIAVIKEIREIWRLPLIDAKNLADRCPSTLQDEIYQGEAEPIAARLRAAGAIVQVRRR